MIFAADYGVVANGSADDTLAMEAAKSAAILAGDMDLVLPSGVICVGDTFKVDTMGMTVRGVNRLGTTIKMMHPTKNILELNGWYSEARDIGFDAAPGRAGGTSVRLLGAHTGLRDFRINNDFVGVHMTGAAASIKAGLLATGLAHGTRILVDGGDTSQLIDDVMAGAQNGPQPDFGIRIVDSAALIIRAARIMNQGTGLALLPGSGQGVHSLYASDCFFDSGSTGLMVAPFNGGHVSRVRFSGCWTGGGTANGVDLHKDGSASTISGVHFSEHHSLDNDLSGFSVGYGVDDFVINGGEIAGNDFGVWIAEAVNGFRVMNATIGQGAGMVPNRKWGVFVGNYCNNYQVRGNTLLNNGGGGCNVMSNQFGKVDNIG